WKVSPSPRRPPPPPPADPGSRIHGPVVPSIVLPVPLGALASALVSVGGGGGGILESGSAEAVAIAGPAASAVLIWPGSPASGRTGSRGPGAPSSACLPFSGTGSGGDAGGAVLWAAMAAFFTLSP